MNVAIQLPSMLRRLDVDAGQSCDSFMPLLERAAMTCAICPKQGVCKAWLDSGGAPEYWRVFCPNSRLIDWLPKRHLQRGDRGSAA